MPGFEWVFPTGSTVAAAGNGVVRKVVVGRGVAPQEAPVHAASAGRPSARTAARAGLALAVGLAATAGFARQPVAQTTQTAAQTAAQSVATPAADDSGAAVIAAVRAAAVAYATAFNARDGRALAEQWTQGALLEEGTAAIKGRDAILASLADWRTAHPEATLAIGVSGVQPLGATAARVQGTLTFTSRPGAESRVSHFDSLRVLEGGVWRIAESRVVPTPRAALSDLGWMVGTWRSTDAESGVTVDATYEKSLEGHAIIGRITITRKDGTTLESLDLIHADRATGLVRSLVVDSSGARAEGMFASDGTSFNRTFVGTPADPALGDHVRWVQVLAPAGPDGLLVHAIDRTVDGRSVPDRAPVHFRRVGPAPQPR
jgi:hypothetical protein